MNKSIQNLMQTDSKENKVHKRKKKGKTQTDFIKKENISITENTLINVN